MGLVPRTMGPVLRGSHPARTEATFRNKADLICRSGTDHTRNAAPPAFRSWLRRRLGCAGGRPPPRPGHGWARGAVPRWAVPGLVTAVALAVVTGARAPLAGSAEASRSFEN